MKKRYAVLIITDDKIKKYFDIFFNKFNGDFILIKNALFERFKGTVFREVEKKYAQKANRANTLISVYEILPDGKISKISAN